MEDTAKRAGEIAVHFPDGSRRSQQPRCASDLRGPHRVGPAGPSRRRVFETVLPASQRFGTRLPAGLGKPLQLPGFCVSRSVARRVVWIAVLAVSLLIHRAFRGPGPWYALTIQQDLGQAVGFDQGYVDAKWGDYDRDGDFDLVFLERIEGGGRLKLMLNQGGVFRLDRHLPVGIFDSCDFDCADYNGDGYLDFAVYGRETVIGHGYAAASNSFLRIYYSVVDGSTGALARYRSMDIANPSASGRDLWNSAKVRWVDMDNDSRLDIFLLSLELSGFRFTIYRQSPHGFVRIVPKAFSIQRDSGDFYLADLDKDGDQDVVVSSTYPSGIRIFSNLGSNTFEENHSLELEYFGDSLDMADFDSDGDLDLLVSSPDLYFSVPSVKILRNDLEDGFAVVHGEQIGGISFGRARWVDFQNDGLEEVVVVGLRGFNEMVEGDFEAKVYGFDGNGVSVLDFKNVISGLAAGYATASARFQLSPLVVEPGDVEQDGVAEILIGGSFRTAGGYFSNGGFDSWVSEALVVGAPGSRANTPPSAPSGLSAVPLGDGKVRFSWAASGDGESSSRTVSYDLYLRRQGEERYRSSRPFSDSPGAYRRVLVRRGAYSVSPVVIGNLELGKYFWTVQGVDKGGMGSPIPEQVGFTVSGPSTKADFLSYQIEESWVDSIFLDPLESRIDVRLNTAEAPATMTALSIAFDLSAGAVARIGGIVQQPAASTLNYNGEVEYEVVAEDGTTRKTWKLIIHRALSFEQRTFSAGSGFQSLEGMIVGDFDRSGSMDVALPVRPRREAISSSSVQILFGQGGSLDQVRYEVPVYDQRMMSAHLSAGDILLRGGLDLYLTSTFGERRQGVDPRTLSIVDRDLHIESKILEDLGKGNFGVRNGILGGPTGEADWADFDNDGDLDIVICGLSAHAIPSTRVYSNQGDGNFLALAEDGLEPLSDCHVQWGDFDADGFSDLALGGTRSNGFPALVFARNVGGKSFEEFFAWKEVEDLFITGVDWGDFDRDGDLDLLAGLNILGDYSPALLLFEYTGGPTGVREHVPSEFHHYRRGSQRAKWADMDGDGWLDIVAIGAGGFFEGSGTSYYSIIAKVLKNTGGGGEFVSVPMKGIPDLQDVPPFLVADVDGDLDLDVLLGNAYPGSGIFPLILNGADLAVVYNLSGGGGQPPPPPLNLRTQVGSSADVTFTWDPPSTFGGLPPAGFSYEVFVGESPGVYNRTPATAIFSTGRRVKVARGRIQGTSWEMKGLEPGDYVWSVQTVDSRFAGSPLAGEAKFTIPDTVPLEFLDFSIEGAVVELDRENRRILVFPSPDVGLRSLVATFRATPGMQVLLADAIQESGVTTNDFTLPLVYTIYSADLGSGTDWEVVVDTNPIRFSAEGSRGLPPMEYGSIDFGDYDRDGRLDVLVTGLISSGVLHDIPVTRVYHNEGPDSPFQLQSIIEGTPGAIGGVPGLFLDNSNGVFYGEGKWVDFDGDGWLDFVVCGFSTKQRGGQFGLGYNPSQLLIYLQENGAFQISWVVHLQQYLPAVSLDTHQLKIFDKDLDGDPDLILDTYYPEPRIGHPSNPILISSGVGRILITNNLPGEWDLVASFENLSIREGRHFEHDTDQDGDVDRLTTGNASTGPVTLLKLRGTFQNPSLIRDEFVAVAEGWAGWGDIDLDGDLDMLLTGASRVGPLTRVMEYDRVRPFYSPSLGVSLTGMANSAGAIGDWDRDTDLDFLLSGVDDAGAKRMELYENSSPLSNMRPGAPGNLVHVLHGGKIVQLSWTVPSDDRTPPGGISYDVYLGRESGQYDVTPYYTLADGVRTVSRSGRFLQETAVFQLEDFGTYYWVVQAVDSGFEGSTLSAEDSFTLRNIPPQDLILTLLDVREEQATGTVMGHFSVIDPDIGDEHEITLVAGEGADDNDLFVIDGLRLLNGQELDHESRRLYLIRVRAGDGGGEWIEKEFVIEIQDVDDRPIDIMLTPAYISRQDSLLPLQVGKLTTVDPGAPPDSRYQYTLSGGFANNEEFTLIQDHLFLDLGSYSNSFYLIQVRTTQSDGAYFEKKFRIPVIDGPLAILIGRNVIADALRVQFFQQGAYDVKIYSISGVITHSQTIQGPSVVGVEFDFRDQAAGVYILNVSYAGRSENFKIVKVGPW